MRSCTCTPLYPWTPPPPSPSESPGGGLGGSLAPKSHGAQGTEGDFSSGSNAVVVERSGLGPRAWSPDGGGGRVFWDVKWGGGGGMEVLQWPYTVGGPPPPPPDQRDHRGKKRNLPLEKSSRAVFGAHTFWSQSPPAPPSPSSAKNLLRTSAGIVYGGDIQFSRPTI